MNSTLQTLFGSGSSAGVMAFLASYKQGYASEISRFIDMDLYAVQKQLNKFEGEGILVSHTQGRAKIYSFDKAHPLYKELISLVGKAARLQKKTGTVESRSLLPQSLREFFWDYHFDQLSWDSDRDMVVRRLLTHGTWEAITWLRTRIGDGELRKWLIEHRGRGLSPRQLRFWSLVLALPDRQVNAWLGPAQADPWRSR
jgi:hypothetical protein